MRPEQHFWPHRAGTLAYSLQLYFDFSGYSDMAVGIARMFSIRFPINFNSPYKAANIIDFWQRWHMTLTRYITLYLYNPIALWMARRRMAAGKSASGKARARLDGFAAMVLLPIMVTMTLAGIWHGAGLQFLIFGLLHGLYISINHAWRIFGPKPALSSAPPWTRALGRVFCVLLTYLAVLLGQVFFRAPSSADAVQLLGALTGLHGAGSPNIPVDGHILLPSIGADGVHLQDVFILIAVLFTVVWAMPNTQQILGKFSMLDQAALPRSLQRLAWRPNVAWGMALGLVLLLSVLWLHNEGKFLYFQF